MNVGQAFGLLFSDHRLKSVPLDLVSQADE
jgi:hypothetical protein